MKLNQLNPVSAKTDQTRTVSFYILYIIFGLAALGTIVNFGLTLTSGLSPDGQLYLLLAKIISQGRPLYLSAIDHQPPGFAFGNVPFIWLFGSTVMAGESAVFFYDLLLIGSIVYIAFTLTKLRASALIALLVGAYYVGFQTGVEPSFYAAVFVAAGLALALFAQTRNGLRVPLLILAGALLGLAFMTKATIALELPALWIILYLNTRRVRDIAVLSAALLVGVCAIGGYFLLTGDFYEMLYTTFGENTAYVGINIFNIHLIGTPPNRWDFFRTIFIPGTLPYFGFLVTAALGTHIYSLRTKLGTRQIAVILWLILALVNAALAIAQETRYFVHIIAPFTILLSVSVPAIQQRRIVRWGLIGLSPLLIIPIFHPSATRNQVLTDGYTGADFQSSVNFLNQNLKPGDCFLTWGELRGLNLFSDYPSCNRVAVDGSMMIQEVFDIGQMRAWYLSDTLQKKPTLFEQEHIWEPFPALRRLIDLHENNLHFHDVRLNADYTGLDWSHFHESSGVVNGELLLIGYDLVPDALSSGQTLDLTMYWKVLKQPTHEYQGFVQLTTSDFSSKVIGIDAAPTDPYISTLAWNRAGEIIIGRTYQLTVPNTIESGNYALVTGMYGIEHNSVVPVPVTDAGGHTLPFIILQNVAITGSHQTAPNSYF